MADTFVIRLSTGQYFAGRTRHIAMSSPRLEDAETYPTRYAALAECAQGPADFFDHAGIEPQRPQDAPAAAGGPTGAPEAQNEPQEAPGAQDGGK